MLNSLEGIMALSAIPPQDYQNGSSEPESTAYPMLNSLDKQMMIATLNAIERTVDGGNMKYLDASEACKLEIFNSIDQNAIDEYDKTDDVGFDLDDVIETLADLGIASAYYEFTAFTKDKVYRINITKALELRDKLFEEWNRADLLVEGLKPDGTLYRAVSMEEFSKDPAKYMNASGELNLRGLELCGYTMENIDSGLPVVISADDFETAAKEFLSHDNSLEEFI